MLPFLKPKAPISTEAQAWVAEGFARLGEFCPETDPAAVPVILPTEAFFPDPLDGGEGSLRRLFARVCGYMGVAPDDVDFEIAQERNEFGEGMRKILRTYREDERRAAGLYRHPGEDWERPVITLNVKAKNDFIALVATMAHELAHVRLLFQAGMDRDVPAMEPLTDLMTVYCGLGIFTANSAFRFQQYDDGKVAGFRTQRLGYLPGETFGYALAVFARLRGETVCPWAKFLNTNVGAYFRQSHRFLRSR